MKLIGLITYAAVCAFALGGCTLRSPSESWDARGRESNGSAGSDASFAGNGGSPSADTGGSTGLGGASGIAEPSGSLQMFVWFDSDREQEAFHTLLNEFSARYPQVDVENTAAHQYPVNGHEELDARLRNRVPPDVFQTLPGASLRRWVRYEGDVHQSRVAPLESLAATGGWRKVFPSQLLESLSEDGSLYAAPLNLARRNVLFFDPKLFERAGINPPYTLPDLQKSALELKAKGLTPLSVGCKAGWPITLLVFDVMLPAVAGSEFRDQFLLGKATADDSRLIEALKETASLLRNSNADRGELDWQEALARVATGNAAMSISGDWGVAALAERGRTLGVDYEAMVAPGTAGIFVFEANVFAKAADARNQQAADAFLGFLASEAGQVAFSRQLGSVPARLDVDDTAFSAMVQEELSALERDTLVLTVESAINPGLLPELHNVMREFGIDANHERVLAFLKEKYSKFAQ